MPFWATVCKTVRPMLWVRCLSVPIQHKVAWAEDYLHTKWHLDPSSHLAATDMGRKLRGVVPLWRRGSWSHLTQCGQGRGLPACQVSSWFIQPFGHDTPTLQTGQTDRQRSDSIGLSVLETVTQQSSVFRTVSNEYWQVICVSLCIAQVELKYENSSVLQTSPRT